MTPAIAISLLVALIALIGAVCQFHITPWGTQISFRIRRGGRFSIYTNTWVAVLTGVATLAGLFVALTSIHFNPHVVALIFGGSGILFGANTINWLWPATGATGPTAAQVQNQDSVIIDLTTDGVTTTQTFTHNLNISAADITAGWPIIDIIPNSPTGIPATLLILVTRPVTANAVVITYAAVAATFRVIIQRPHTIGR